MYREDRFSTLKVCVRGQRRPEHKMTVSELLKNANDHPGKRLVRLVLNSSEAIDPRAKHPCLVYQPLGMNFTEFRDLFPGHKFPKSEKSSAHPNILGFHA
jgi:hypothetical protein